VQSAHVVIFLSLAQILCRGVIYSSTHS